MFNCLSFFFLQYEYVLFQIAAEVNSIFLNISASPQIKLMLVSIYHVACYNVQFFR